MTVQHQSPGPGDSRSPGLPRTVLVSSIMALACIALLFWTIHPSPFLVISIALSLSACGMAVLIFLRKHAFLVLPLALMFFLMALRQTLVLLVRADVMSATPAADAICDFPGLLITGLAIYTILYFQRTIKGQEQLLQTQKELLRAEREYKTLVENITAVTYKATLDKNATLLFVSPQIEKVLGYSAAECRKDPVIWRRRIHPNDRDHVLSEIRQCHKTGDPFIMEYRVLHKDGQAVWVHDEAVVERGSRGAPLHFHGVLSDITAFKKIEVELETRNSELQIIQTELQRSEELFRTFFESSRDAILILEGNMILDGNDAARTILGCLNTNDLVAKKYGDFSPPRQPDGRKSDETLNEQIKKTLERGSAFFEWTMRRCDGTPFPAEILLSRFEHQGKTVLQAVVRDITSRKRMVEQVRHADRLDATAQLADGMAHDFKNMLTGILAYADLLVTRTVPGSPEHDAVQKICAATERAADLTRRLLGAPSEEEQKTEPVDLHDMIHRVAALLDRTIDSKIGITLELGAKKAIVTGNPDQIKDLLVSLAQNACDAMPDGGELTFTTETVDADDKLLSFDKNAANRRYLALTVSDTGRGIPEEIRGRIFEPFFTTKTPDDESGMGLAVAQGIVAKHHGFIQIDSSDGTGAAILVHFPLARTGETAARKRGADDTVRIGGRILLVDDEEVVRDVVTTILVNSGFQVVPVSSGEEALEQFRNYRNEIDLVIIDMMMPKMDGAELFHRLKEIDPGVKTIVATGYGPCEKTATVLDQGALGFLQKPFKSKELISTIMSAIIANDSVGIGNEYDEDRSRAEDGKKARTKKLSYSGAGKYDPER